MSAPHSLRGLTRPLVRASIEATLRVASELGFDPNNWDPHEDVSERGKHDGAYRRDINWSQRGQPIAYSRATLQPRKPWRIDVHLRLWYGTARVGQWVRYNPLTGRTKLMTSSYL